MTDLSHDQLTADLNELADSLPKSVPSKSPPAVLFHYTSPDGLLGLLKNRHVWASDALHMNDTRELTHGLEILDEVVEDIARSAATPDSASVFLLRETIRHMRPQPCATYLACFSEHGDQLSQWRAYARDGLGYAVGFSADALQNLKVPTGWRGDGPRLVQVIYDRAIQKETIRSVVQPVVEKVEAFWATKPSDRAKGDALTHGLVLLQHVLSPLFAQFKNTGFEEEAEWRVVLTWEGWPMLKPTMASFRPTRFGLTAYAELEFAHASIAEVVHGPRHEPMCMPLTEIAFEKYVVPFGSMSRSLSSYR